MKSEQFSTKLLKVHSKSAACERHIGRIDFLREQNKHFNFFPIWSRMHHKYIKLRHSQLFPEYISCCLLLSSIYLGLLSQTTVCTTAYSKQNAYWSDNTYRGSIMEKCFQRQVLNNAINEKSKKHYRKTQAKFN